MKVFIVDDEPDILRLYSLYLEMRGDEVILTSDPKEGLDIVNSQSFDLIITDKRMPEVSGLEIIDLVEKKHPQTPIFLITGDHDIDHKFLHNDSKVILKPIFREALLEEIEKIESKINPKESLLNA